MLRKIFSSVFISLLLFQNIAFAQTTGIQEVKRTFFATVTSPSVGELLSVEDMDPADTTDDFYTDQILVKGVAQRQSAVDLYIFTKVPELISNFRASGSLSSGLTLEWDPREVFLCSGDGCRGDEYYGYVRPGETFGLFDLIGGDMPNWVSNPPTDSDDTFTCQGGECLYNSRFEITWFDDEKNIIDPAQIIESKKGSHTYTAQLKEITTAEWIDTGNSSSDLCFSPADQNLLSFDQSPSFLFQQLFSVPSAYAAPNARGGGASPLPPTPSDIEPTPECRLEGQEIIETETFRILVDDFARYTIVYGDTNVILPDRGVSYYENDHITFSEAVDWTADVYTNPLTNSVTIDGLDAGKIYRFALFEIRRQSDYTQTPHTNVLSSDSPYPLNADSVVTPADLSGYLFTARNQNGGNEIHVSPSDILSPPSIETPEKVELELVQQDIPTNNDENFNTSFYRMALNPASRTHFIAATYESTDTMTQVGDPKTLSIRAQNRIAFFDINDIAGGQWILNANITYANTEPSPSGVVYDAWTGEPLSDVLLQVKGSQTNLGETSIEQEVVQRTNLDGLYSFFLSSGTYTLTPLSVNGTQNNFKFPIPSCPPSDFYTDHSCGEEFQIIDNTAKHFDVPIMPTVYGTAPADSRIVMRNTDTDEQFFITSFPDGKYSFYVPPGSYQFESLKKPDEEEQSLSQNVTVPDTKIPKEVNL